MKKVLFLLFIFVSASCVKEELFSDDTRINLWLFHEGAEMPVVVDGNTNSKTFILFIHGGPGGHAQVLNNFFTPLSDLLEKDYAMVYWDQRNSGISRGEWKEDKINIEQYVEDLDQVIELMKFKFGSDISLFLVGSSWGGYLGQAYLVDQDRQAKINGWINIDGLNNRNQNLKDALQRILEVGNDLIALQVKTEEWTDLLTKVQEEIDRNTQQYDVVSENRVFNLIRNAETIISKSRVLTYDLGSAYQSVFKDNTHPYILASNKRVLDILIPQMFSFDNSLDALFPNINLPSLFLYGKFDVRTPLAQAEYVINNISTPVEDKELIILQTSDHSSLGNQPVEIANSVHDWVERYK